MIPEYFAFTLPTKMIYNSGFVERIASELNRFGKRKALVVTDATIEKAGLLAKLQSGMQGGSVAITAIFKDVPQNSELKTVTAATELAKGTGCNFIIALGGGSVLDTAKVVNILLSKGGGIREHIGAQLIQDRLYPMVFIPTTAGTGSEVTQFAMIADTQNDLKLPFAEDAILPELAILDPEMTVTMPAKVTAATGMDALTHAIESYVSKEANPVSQALSLQAIALISQNILQATAHPDDTGARGAMLVASFLAGVAFNHSGVGMVHAISHALGGVYHIPHGVANSIILPFSVEYNLATSVARYAQIAEVLGFVNILPGQELAKVLGGWQNAIVDHAVAQLSIVDDWITEQKALGLAARIRLLNQQLAGICGHPLDLQQAGVNDGLGKLPQLVKTAMKDGTMLFNPHEVTPNTVESILRQAYQQNLTAIEVTAADLKAVRAGVIKPKLKNIFSDAEALYDILGGFYRNLASKGEERPELKKTFLNSGIKIKFVYNNPDAYITIDASNSEVKIYDGKDGDHVQVDIELGLEADLAHYFWHGEVNAVQALTRREVSTKGDLAKAMQLLPLLNPAYEIYPQFLREKGLARLIVA
ncbi:MAG: iron-containing alcohol dehydrogenase [Spirochaetota bacterium]